MFSFVSSRAKLLAAKNKSIGPIEKALRVHKVIKCLTIVCASLIIVHMLLLSVDFKRCKQCNRTIDKSMVVIGCLLILPSVGLLSLNAYTLRHYTQTTETEIDLSETPEAQFREALLSTRNELEEFYLEPEGIP